MQNAIFIDTTTLNVIFKVGGRFVLSTNYNSCPSKIAVDAQALGTSFDVYISVWPRQSGESKDTVRSLSIGGVPFVVIREEMESIINLMKDVSGVGNIYICNALANFITQAKVENFQSVINYGNRMALITVKKRMLESLRIFNSSDELFAEMGTGFSCYGDLDLIDTDAIKAQYDEFTPFNKNIIVPLAHLISSYRSHNNVELDVVERELHLGEYLNTPIEVEDTPKKTQEETPKVQKREPIKPVKEVSSKSEEKFTDSVEFKKPGVSLINVLMIGVILGCSAILGLGYSLQKIDSEVVQLGYETSAFREESSRNKELESIYLNCIGLADYAADVLDYAKHNQFGFTIAGMEIDADRIVLRCNSIDQYAMENMREYMSVQYVVAEVNSLDTTVGANDTVIYNYNMIIVRR